MEVLEKLSRLDLLVLDEVGVSFGTEPEKVQLFNVINGRYNQVRPTIVTSNLDVAGMTAYLGERSMDRLKENAADMVVLTGQSRRAPRRK
jgi:DNA replication protein DnaC